uniref:Uncharacterized protein n=1 Tax=Molossus molossus TaxID=27622 RepID=A0A7J8F8R6_MOLMO|nr:hypothetical protein HJG59_008462 [Molossus molossus]
MPSRSIHVAAKDKMAFSLWLCNIPTHRAPRLLQPFVFDGRSGGFHLLAIVTLRRTEDAYVFLFWINTQKWRCWAIWQERHARNRTRDLAASQSPQDCSGRTQITPTRWTAVRVCAPSGPATPPSPRGPLTAGWADQTSQE